MARALAVLAAILVSAAAYGQATVTQENVIVPIDFVITACNGETVIFTGESHMVQNSAANGNGAHSIVHINFHLEGTGPSGTRYIVNEHLNGPFTLTFTGADTQTSEARLVAVAQGSEDNLIVHTFIHTTTNANGEITSTTFEFESECQG